MHCVWILIYKIKTSKNTTERIREMEKISEEMSLERKKREIVLTELGSVHDVCIYTLDSFH